MQTFAFAHGPDWRACVEALGRPGRGLGFVYFTDALVDASQEILSTLKSETGVDDWIGTVGTGVLATGTEYQDGPALAAMVADVDAFSVFSGRTPLKSSGSFAVVHADPAAPDLPGLVADMSAKVAGRGARGAARTAGYIVGGVSSSRSRTVQIANEVLTGGLSGAVLGEEVAVATRLTQGCTPYPGRFRVTEGEDNLIARLDGRPALEVMLEAVGGERTQLLVGLPVPGSDTGDYTARNIVGVDPKAGLLAIGDLVEPGMEILFCKRDAAAAGKDLEGILASLKRDAPHPRGALYYSCVARGEHMFGRRGAELDLVKRSLGEVPLVGFFCNGEISRDRLYGYTGVLTVFR
ncbi:MAG TPA: FIST C-terminal domain-containing protein [Burkholderiales bacterium]|jgi:small ligand-binding sensory domain FIST|nr:FIST C-terminal domain-containing protein [Burkholderiales bacterium]